MREFERMMVQNGVRLLRHGLPSDKFQQRLAKEMGVSRGPKGALTWFRPASRNRETDGTSLALASSKKSPTASGAVAERSLWASEIRRA